MDTGAARRLQGVELHVEVLTGGGDASVADGDGHGPYDTMPTLAPGGDLCARLLVSRLRLQLAPWLAC